MSLTWANDYAKAKFELKKLEQPQNDLMRELTGKDITHEIIGDEPIRLLLQYILDRRAQRVVKVPSK